MPRTENGSEIAAVPNPLSLLNGSCLANASLSTSRLSSKSSLSHSESGFPIKSKTVPRAPSKQAAFAHCFGQVDYELGVIAGNRPIDPISSRIIGKPNGGKVSINSTMLEGMKDHIVIPSSHTFLTSNKAAWQQTLAFLINGEFNRP